MSDSLETTPQSVVPARRLIVATPLREARVIDDLPDDFPDDLPDDLPEVLPKQALADTRSHWLIRGFYAVTSAVEWCFGVAAVFIGLAVLAAIPVVQFLSLGYLLEAGGRVARTGRLRDGLIGVRFAARLGGVVLGAWVLLLPVRFVSDLTVSASIIEPGSRIAWMWRTGLFVLIGLTAFHILTVCARGGKLRYFFWPFNFAHIAVRIFQGGYYAETRDAVWDSVVSLRLPYYFWLGVRGFAGAFLWLVVPVSFLALGRQHFPIAPLFNIIGAPLLLIVLLYLPFLQMRLAQTNRFRGAFEVQAVRADFRRAPWAFLLAFVVTLLFALPLYLLKIEVIPREAAWMPSLVFILFIYPARLLTGWALGRAAKRATPRHWVFRWSARLLLLPAAVFYGFIVYFSQYIGWNGIWGLYEQHAFLLPVPLFRT